METQYVLSEAQWAVLVPLLPGRRGPAGPDNRRFVEAVLWLARSGVHWRALPPAWSNWYTTYTHFARWAKSGAWGHLLAAMQAMDMTGEFLAAHSAWREGWFALRVKHSGREGSTSRVGIGAW